MKVNPLAEFGTLIASSEKCKQGNTFSFPREVSVVQLIRVKWGQFRYLAVYLFKSVFK